MVSGATACVKISPIIICFQKTMECTPTIYGILVILQWSLVCLAHLFAEAGCQVASSAYTAEDDLELLVLPSVSVFLSTGAAGVCRCSVCDVGNQNRTLCVLGKHSAELHLQPQNVCVCSDVSVYVCLYMLAVCFITLYLNFLKQDLF